MRLLKRLKSQRENLLLHLTYMRAYREGDDICRMVDKNSKKWSKKKLRRVASALATQYMWALCQLGIETELSKTENSPQSDGPMPIIVSFDGSTTTVTWKDGTETSAVCDSRDTFDKRVGVAICMAKKAYGEDYPRMLGRIY